MHHSGNDDAIDVGENFFERLGIFGRLGRQRAADGARFIVRPDGQLPKSFAKIGDPVGELIKLLSKNFRRRVAELWLVLHCSDCH